MPHSRSGSFTARALVLIGVFLLAAPGLTAQGPAAPTHLRTEYLTNPLGMDVPAPRFSWIDEAGSVTDRGELQTAYELLVASRRELLDRDQGDQWATSKVSSGDSIQIAYAGKALESGRTYYWKVRWWDQDGRASPYSGVATFEMGLLSRAEWKGQWIGGGNELRTEFSLPESPARARAYICGLGYYELRVNGAKAGTNFLDPAWTTFDKRVLYSTYDVTPMLRKGANAVGVMLGQGWFGSRELLFELNVELPGGKTLTVSSKPDWKARNGPVTSDSVWDGEVYDARLESPGWDLPGFDAAGWSSAQPAKDPGGELSAEMLPPIRVTDTLVPVAVTNPDAGVYVFDMGQNFAGWARLRAEGPRGTTVTLRYSELIYPNGMINRENLREAKSRDVYVLKGGGPETYEPHFTYHGFRYVEVTGYPGTPSLDALRGRVAHSAVELVGGFAASNPLLNQIHKIVRWSQLSNLHSIPTDCPQRNERQGWMGDAQADAEATMMNFDMAAFYTNFVRDIRDAERPDGEVPDTVPHRYGSYPADPAWGTAYPILCWYMYEQYADRRILEENYDGLKRYVAFLKTRAPDNVLRYSYYGDWVAIEPTPGALVSDAYYFYDVQILASAAEVLGKSDDAREYRSLAGQIQDAFNREFFDPKTGNYANGSQTALALPLFFDLVPKELRGHVAGRLYNDIVYGHDTHVTTGFIGVRYLLPVLTRVGHPDIAYELAAQTTYPSWGYMVASGATTLWELWQNKTGPSMNSHNHHMFGSVDAWFYQALAGINLDENGAGYRRIRIEPHAIRDLTWASGSLLTMRGAVESAWSRAPGTVTLSVAIPANSAATVVVPKEEEMTEVTVREGERVVWEKDRFVPGTPGITAGAKTRDGIAFTLGSGNYLFTLTGH